ncbi:hypothetical protein [Marimonas arenosa]|uniref:Arylsulfatase n=1 Tax=Marimonas arenosa TaxID=1795305 RepID=A0AAE3WC48_9RHOB|nr:hypothetical protein [Marimonas arenosa]MDQ2089768.1 hypothetical protein [Marimonas arenosa]
MKLTLLHTSPVHVVRFNALRDRIAPHAELHHVVREDLLERARTDGVTPEIAAAVAQAVRESPLLCTCSTLGAAAERAGAIRIDRPAMRTAARAGDAVMLVYCLETTAAPSRALLEEEMQAAGNGAGIETLFVSEAWPLFESGNETAFRQMIAETVRATQPRGSVVLAQASMDGAAGLLGDLNRPVLATPEIALRTALAC